MGDHLDDIYEYRDGVAVCRIDRTMPAHLGRRLSDAGLIRPDGQLDPPDLPAAAELGVP